MGIKFMALLLLSGTEERKGRYWQHSPWFALNELPRDGLMTFFHLRVEDQSEGLESEVWMLERLSADKWKLTVRPWNRLRSSCWIKRVWASFSSSRGFKKPNMPFPSGCGGSVGIWVPVLLKQLAYSCIKGGKRDSVFQDVSMYH